MSLWDLLGIDWVCSELMELNGRLRLLLCLMAKRASLRHGWVVVTAVSARAAATPFGSSGVESEKVSASTVAGLLSYALLSYIHDTALRVWWYLGAHVPRRSYAPLTMTRTLMKVGLSLIHI